MRRIWKAKVIIQTVGQAFQNLPSQWKSTLYYFMHLPVKTWVKSSLCLIETKKKSSAWLKCFDWHVMPQFNNILTLKKWFELRALKPCFYIYPLYFYLFLYCKFNYAWNVINRRYHLRTSTILHRWSVSSCLTSSHQTFYDTERYEEILTVIALSL